MLSCEKISLKNCFVLNLMKKLLILTLRLILFLRDVLSEMY